MARTHDAIDDSLHRWIERQPVFFVASAPDGPDGHVNVSPKGYDSFRVLGPTEVAYLDLTGSGAETVAHLRQNGRITVMFCAFEGPPRILRLYGRGEAVLRDDDRFGPLAAAFPERASARAVIRIDLDRIQTSCGYAVPFMALEGERPLLDEWSERKSPSALEDYRTEKNARSIDGLPALRD
jgi:hypothetical protein